MSPAFIEVIEARENNLQGLTVSIPRGRLVAVTGVSGSGKSTLVHDTIYAEAQRAFLESISSYARASMPRLQPPQVTAIRGLSPAILINQRPLGANPRSTVGTYTELYTHLRLLFSRLGEPALSAGDFSFNTPAGACPNCTGLGEELAPDLDRLLDRSRSLQQGAILHRAWKVGSRYWNIIRATGLFDMARPLRDFRAADLELLLQAESRECANTQPGFVQRFSFEGVVRRLQARLKDGRGQAGRTYDQEFFSLQPCRACSGSRLNERARSVRVRGKGLVEVLTLELPELGNWLDSLPGPIATAIVTPMRHLLNHLLEVGVGYLGLNRAIGTLSGGEAQRVKLARQLGSPLTEMLYVLDEPTAGLHARDVDRLVQLLRGLVGKPNTVLVVEHDRQLIVAADHIVDLGPGAGAAGGRVVAEGTPAEVMRSGTATGQFLAGREKAPPRPRHAPSDFLELTGLTRHNLQGLTVRLPRQTLIGLCGVSGSGKSTLLACLLEQQRDAVWVDQSPVGASPRANPATYVGAFDDIRKEFARESGRPASLFTFNGDGACPACNGLGLQIVDMHFLGDVRQPCPECAGKRFSAVALEARYRGRTIADVLDLTIEQAWDFFATPAIRRKLGLLVEVGLGYLRLGQPLSTLSGGEAQRVKLASELGQHGRLYALDEPTRGLHHADVARLSGLLLRLVEAGNTVVVVEHNLDVLGAADWLIELGPGGGREGGRVVCAGPPEDVAACTRSLTGQYLAALLGRRRAAGKARNEAS